MLQEILKGTETARESCWTSRSSGSISSATSTNGASALHDPPGHRRPARPPGGGHDARCPAGLGIRGVRHGLRIRQPDRGRQGDRVGGRGSRSRAHHRRHQAPRGRGRAAPCARRRGPGHAARRRRGAPRAAARRGCHSPARRARGRHRRRLRGERRDLRSAPCAACRPDRGTARAGGKNNVNVDHVAAAHPSGVALRVRPAGARGGAPARCGTAPRSARRTCQATAANQAADAILAGLREAEAQRQRRAQLATSAIATAQAHVERAIDFITTRRHGVGRTARTRAAEADARLTDARTLRGRRPRGRDTGRPRGDAPGRRGLRPGRQRVRCVGRRRRAGRRTLFDPQCRRRRPRRGHPGRDHRRRPVRRRTRQRLGWVAVGRSHGRRLTGRRLRAARFGGGGGIGLPGPFGGGAGGGGGGGGGRVRGGRW